MIIKMLGLEIRTGADQTDKQPQPEVQMSQSTALALPKANSYTDAEAPHSQYGANVREKRSFFSPSSDKRLNGLKIAKRSGRSKMVDDIVLPPPPAINDPLDSEIYINHVEKFRKEMLEGSFFSICEVDKLMRVGQIQLNTDTSKSYEYLNSMHCKHYRDMPKHAYALLVACINYVFTEGESPNPDDLFNPV